MMHVPELYRMREGPMGSDATFGNNGAFDLSVKFDYHDTFAIASQAAGWEHVSVSHPNYTPTWEEMCIVKDLFWDEEDCVMQLHPPKSDYVDRHRHCLHLWRPMAGTGDIPRPPKWMVG